MPRSNPSAYTFADALTTDITRVYVNSIKSAVVDIDANGTYHTAYGGTPAVSVAASNAPATLKARADYVCTGTADDVTINAQIAAMATAGGGKIILLGDFTIVNPIRARSYVEVDGGSPQYTSITAVNAYSPSNLTLGQGSGRYVVSSLQSDAVTGFTIRNILIDANEPNATVGLSPSVFSHALGLYAVSNLTIDNVHVRRAIRYSIYSEGGTNVRVANCDVLTGQGAATVGGVAREQQDGIHLADVQDATIHHNRVVTAGLNNVGDDGIVVRSGTNATFSCRDVVISDNRVSADQTAIKLVGASTSAQDVRGVTITGNVSFDGYGGFVNLDAYAGYTGKFRNVVVAGNEGYNFLGPDTHLLWISSGGVAENFDTVTFANNIIDGVAQRGAFAIGGVWGKNLAITGNQLRNARVDRGIMVGDTGKPVVGFVISDNIVDMTLSVTDNNVGIAVRRSSRGAVTGNTVTGTKANALTDTSPGINLAGDATNFVTDVTVTGNGVYDCTYGVRETGASDDFNIISDNAVRTCTTTVGKLGVNTITVDNV